MNGLAIFLSATNYLSGCNVKTEMHVRKGDMCEMKIVAVFKEKRSYPRFFFVMNFECI
jgi:hypothetical protein